MCNKLRLLKLILIGAAVCGFPDIAARAHSVSIPSESLVNAASKVQLIDGIDRDSRVTIKAWLDAPQRSVFDFGFMNDGLYVPMTGKSHTRGGYTFAGGSVVDFALRDRGVDSLFGTPDDVVYRLSDSADYARQTYYKPVKSSKSRNPTVTQVYFRDLRLNWDLDLDGKPDVRTWLEFKRGKHDGMMPAPAAVPLPAALWLFGSGLLGLGLKLTVRHRNQVVSQN